MLKSVTYRNTTSSFLEVYGRKKSYIRAIAVGYQIRAIVIIIFTDLEINDTQLSICVMFTYLSDDKVVIFYLFSTLVACLLTVESNLCLNMIFVKFCKDIKKRIRF